MTGFFHMFNSVSAQAACAASSCPEMTNIALILDAGLLLASIIILPVLLVLVRHAYRETTSPPLRPALQA